MTIVLVVILGVINVIFLGTLFNELLKESGMNDKSILIPFLLISVILTIGIIGVTDANSREVYKKEIEDGKYSIEVNGYRVLNGDTIKTYNILRIEE